MKPPIPLHDSRFVYVPASDHADPASFRARMAARRHAAQRPTNIKPIRKGARA